MQLLNATVRGREGNDKDKEDDKKYLQLRVGVIGRLSTRGLIVVSIGTSRLRRRY